MPPLTHTRLLPALRQLVPQSEGKAALYQNDPSRFVLVLGFVAALLLYWAKNSRSYTLLLVHIDETRSDYDAGQRGPQPLYLTPPHSTPVFCGPAISGFLTLFITI